ncbi:MAG: hypothetical protein ABW157_17275 [Candidatus Thiodiazotropha sp. LLP2]
MDFILPALVALIALISILITPKAKEEGAFFKGLSPSGESPGLLMLIFLLVLVLLMVLAFSGGHVTLDSLLFQPFKIDQPGPVLMIVALLQIWSYPMHDPVMMDRGFLADRQTTRRSFLHAAWISMICILLFGSLGILAGAQATSGEAMTGVLMRLFGEIPMMLFNAALVISAMSTLDSTLSSSAKLVVVDMKVVSPTMNHGRMAMALFMLLGLMMVFVGNKDLFSAVAVSGTASLYLAPVIFFSLWSSWERIPLWSYLGSFCLSMFGAILYFTESTGYSQFLGDAHKYTKLLYISLTVLLLGCLMLIITSSRKSSVNHMALTVTRPPYPARL